MQLYMFNIKWMISNFNYICFFFYNRRYVHTDFNFGLIQSIDALLKKIVKK